jgi:hypothetical protein
MKDEDLVPGPPQGPWRRLFLDATVVEESKNLSRMFHAAEKHPANPVLKGDTPWEDAPRLSGPYLYGTVMWDEGSLRMWYQWLHDGVHIGYAESLNGVSWTKPSLGIIEFKGSTENNMVISSWQRGKTGGAGALPSVIKRPWETDPAKRYALFCYDRTAGARVAFSPDGWRWTFAAETAGKPLFTSSDVLNFFWDPYRSRYTATWKCRSRRGRSVGVAWSAGGMTWTKPIDGPVFVPDDLDPDATQIYGMPVFPYQGLYIGLPWIYNARHFKYGAYTVQRLHEAQEDSPRTVDVQLAWSWDLINWTRPPQRLPLIPRGTAGEFDSGMIYTARAPVQVGDRLFFYYGGFDGPHDEPKVKGSIGVATLRLDGFCSMRAGSMEGWLITRREPLRAPQVAINAKITEDGYIVAEILDRHNRVLPGFSRGDCVPFRGDAVRHVLQWKMAQFPRAQMDGDKKIRFYLRNADLYSYLPTP